MTTVKRPILSRIITAFLGHNIAEPLNISQISREIGAAYPHTYNAVSELIDEHILIAKTIGKSRYCTLNLESDRARSLLGTSFVEHKESRLTTKNLQNLNQEIRRLSLIEPSILAAIFHENFVQIVITDKSKTRTILKNTAIPNISFLTPKELQNSLLNSLDLLDGVVLFGSDRLLLLVHPIQQQLMLNHSALFREVEQ